MIVTLRMCENAPIKKKQHVLEYVKCVKYITCSHFVDAKSRNTLGEVL